MKLVFMGTPQFAVPTLARLIADSHEIAAVYTQPDRPSGRGYKLAPPPIKELALAHGIEVFQPATLKSGEEQARLLALAPDCIIVVAYGRILPKGILDIPKQQCINLHASLLPQYRGAAPIQWCVINGEKKSGVCSMRMAQGLDTGDVILRRETQVGENENANELSARLAQLGAACMADTLALYEAGGEIRYEKQDEQYASWAPMIKKELGLVDFSKPAGELHCLVRGLAGWPSAYTYFEGKLLKIHKTLLCGERSGEPGELTVSDGRLFVSCGAGALEILELQLEGKQRTAASVFLNGYQINPHAKFTNR